MCISIHVVKNVNLLTVFILSQDIKDSEVYAHLLVAVCPEENPKGPIGLEPLNVCIETFTDLYLRKSVIIYIHGHACRTIN